MPPISNYCITYTRLKEQNDKLCKTFQKAILQTGFYTTKKLKYKFLCNIAKKYITCICINTKKVHTPNQIKSPTPAGPSTQIGSRWMSSLLGIHLVFTANITHHEVTFGEKRGKSRLCRMVIKPQYTILYTIQHPLSLPARTCLGRPMLREDRPCATLP